jgi:hypothetical protein|tara:strand:+ start:534 stop:737 length:204 start_codon:yes stop_codon:yes gene_type:complete
MSLIMSESSDLRCFSEQYQIKALKNRIESLEILFRMAVEQRDINRIYHEDALRVLSRELSKLTEEKL